MAQLQEAVIVTTTTQGYPGNNAVVVGPGVMEAWTENRRYNPSGGRTLGILQLLLGITSIICGITIASTPYIGGATAITPAWAGWFYLVAGIFGITSSSRRSCSITGFMVFSILSSLFAFVQTFYQGRIVWWFFWGYGYVHWIIYTCMAAAVAGLAEFIISIISAAKCCQGATCCKCCWSSCAGCCGPPAVEVDMAVQYGNQLPVNQAFVSAPNPAFVNQQNVAYPGPSTAAYPNPGTAYPNPGTAYPNPGTAYPNPGTANPNPSTAYNNQAYYEESKHHNQFGNQ